MRVLQLTSHLHIGGITRYVLCLSERLIARNHQIVIASDRGQGEAQAQAIGVTYWPVPLHTSMEFSPRIFRGIKQLAARLEHDPVDIIHAHTRVGQVVADQLAHQLHIPYITTWHGIYTRRLGRRLWPCTGGRTIAISELVRQSLLPIFTFPQRAFAASIMASIAFITASLLPLRRSNDSVSNGTSPRSTR